MATQTICKLDGCCKPMQYKSLGVCQMHYFRRMRTGSYDKKPRTIKQILHTPNGYAKIYAPHLNGVISTENYCYEHRAVVFQRYGHDLPDCDICGSQVDWRTCHIDHINCDRLDNRPEKLRPVCRPCNTRRGRKPEHEYRHAAAITIGDKTQTPTEWAREPDVCVSPLCIRDRKRRGYSDYDAVYAPKITHNREMLSAPKGQ